MTLLAPLALFFASPFVQGLGVQGLRLQGLRVQEPAPPAPLPPLPSARQLRWHELEYYAFVHFNMNTFTDLEWGHGREDPDTFAPTELDCRQWARVCKEAGMRGIILTAKHHDGFCLWPSATTEHTVAASSWRDGQGDVLRELSAACRAEGLLFGVYLSPWDRNHPAYGDSPRYNEVFRSQLREVLSGYGPVFEVWFDGACGEGPNGRRQVYDWPSFVGVVRELQPEACIFSDGGPDVRWVGNERGYAGETNWCLLRRDEVSPGHASPQELTEGHADGTHWVAAECDVSIRPGWYYHAGQDGRVKTLEELVDIWYGSVGRGANLLLNLPVDRRGLVHETDVERLRLLRAALDATFDEDVARGAATRASNARGGAPEFGGGRAVDGDPETFWATDDEVRSATLDLELPEPQLFDRVLLREPIALGQRVERFTVEARAWGAWQRIAAGTTIGARRILRTTPVEADAIRLRIEGARAAPAIASLELYLSPPRVDVATPAQVFLGRTSVQLAASLSAAEVHYTLDGSEPTRRSPRYAEALEIERTCTLKAVAFLGDKRWPAPAVAHFTGYTRETLRPAVHLFRAPSPGLSFRYHEGRRESLEGLAAGEPVATGDVERPDLSVRARDEHFALELRGYLSVPADGIYTFFLASDDGSRLWIGDELVIDNDGLHGLVERSGASGLQAGYHPIRLEYFNATGELGLELAWQGPRIARGPIPDAAFGR